jgi:hypothetical protein
MDGERVDAAFELTDKCFVDHAVALDPALPAERLRHNMHPEMSLPALPMPGMSGVPVRFVHHVEARGSESLSQLLRDEIAPGHGVRIAGARGPVNAGLMGTLPAIALSLVTKRNGGRRPGKMSVPALVQPLLQGLHRLFEILDAEL